MPNAIDLFLSAATYAVAGVSQNKEKFGYKVFRALVASGREVYPLNPAAQEIDGHTAYASLSLLPIVPESLSIVTPAQVTRKIVEEAVALGVKNIWMQPGAEDAIASENARNAGINLIDDGSCVLIALSKLPSRH